MIKHYYNFCFRSIIKSGHYIFIIIYVLIMFYFRILYFYHVCICHKSILKQIKSNVSNIVQNENVRTVYLKKLVNTHTDNDKYIL